MSAMKKPVIARQSSCNTLPCRPLGERKHNRSCSEDGNGNGNRNGNGSSNYVPLVVHIRQNQLNRSCSAAGKENSTPKISEKSFLDDDKENAVLGKENVLEVKDMPNGISHLKSKDKPLKPTSLQLCIQKHEPDSNICTKVWGNLDSDNPNSGNIWDYSDSEAAPASSWSTLPNRSLMYRPLPVDIGRCTCVIVKEALPEGLSNGGTLYSLYTHEGHGRQNRKLAVAHHRRRNGRSEFIVASNMKGITTTGSDDDSLIGHMTANFIGSKYHIWDQGRQINKSSTKKSKLLAAITFASTIASWTGSYRRIKAWIPKHQSMQLKNNTSQHINGLPKGWEEKRDKAYQLFSRVPYYNKMTKQNELDYRDRGRTGLRIQTSVKNFQLTLEKNGKQTILQLGRVGKSQYVMDYRYPMTGFQAFCFCLAAIDSKPCCTV